MINLLMILSGTAFYTYGELKNKWGKYLMGCPIALIYSVCLQSWVPMFTVLTYFIACQIGYGDNNPLTKLVGKRGAITIHGACVGMASIVIVGPWAIVGAIFSGLMFLLIAIADDNGKIAEPWVAILRSLSALGILLI
jgi:hypothetical protein